jgi:hypothetical protein
MQFSGDDQLRQFGVEVQSFRDLLYVLQHGLAVPPSIIARQMAASLACESDVLNVLYFLPSTDYVDSGNVPNMHPGSTRSSKNKLRGP